MGVGLLQGKCFAAKTRMRLELKTRAKVRRQVPSAAPYPSPAHLLPTVPSPAAVLSLPRSFIFPGEMCAGMLSVAGLAPCSSYHQSEFEPRPSPVIECPPSRFCRMFAYSPPQIKIMRSRPSLKRNDGDALTYIRHAM